MVVQEMHIEVNQALQAVASNRRRKLRPEEIDWVLNKQVDRYISLHANELRKGQSLPNTVRLSSLLREKTLLTYQVENKSNVQQASFTWDMQEILSAEAMVEYNCGVQIEPKTERKHTFTRNYEFKKTTALLNFYSVFIIKANGIEIFNIQKVSPGFVGTSSKDEYWPVLDLALHALSSKYNVYYKVVGNTVVTVETNDTLEFIVDTMPTSVPTLVSTLRTTYSEVGNYRPVRFYFNEVIPEMKASAFGDTYYRSPIAYLTNFQANILVDNSFTVNRLNVMYVKRPKKISLILGTDCELPDVSGLHMEICDLSVEYIKKLREDPDWELKLRDNMQRTLIS